MKRSSRTVVTSYKAWDTYQHERPSPRAGVVLSATRRRYRHTCTVMRVERHCVVCDDVDDCVLCTKPSAALPLPVPVPVSRNSSSQTPANQIPYRLYK